MMVYGTARKPLRERAGFQNRALDCAEYRDYSGSDLTPNQEKTI